MDNELLKPIEISFSSVLKEAKEKYSYLNESTALFEYYELQGLILRHNPERTRAMAAHRRRFIAAQLLTTFTVGMN